MSTKSALNMKNAKTDLLRSSINSFATRACGLVNDASVMGDYAFDSLMGEVTMDSFFFLLFFDFRSRLRIMCGR